MKTKLIDIANQLATVREWSELSEETYAGINSVIDSLNELVEAENEKDNALSHIRSVILNAKCTTGDKDEIINIIDSVEVN